MVAGTRLSVVNVGGAWGDRFLPRVGWDQSEAAALAARHLIERGLRSFGYVFQDAQQVPHDVERTTSFRAYVERAGFCCREFTPVSDTSLVNELAAWLQGLPRPCGVFAFNDRRAMDVLVAARLAGLRVPEEIAVVGMDNDADVCEAANPPLSSVSLDARRIGYRAAQLLEQILDGQAPPNEPELVPLPGVVTRRSSDVLHVENPEVAAVLRFIRDHAGEKIAVADLLRVAPMNRRRLERLFKATMGRSMGDELTRVRIETARELLAHSDLSLEKVAARCGLPEMSCFHVAFRKATGTSPAAWWCLRNVKRYSQRERLSPTSNRSHKTPDEFPSRLFRRRSLWFRRRGFPPRFYDTDRCQSGRG